MCDWFVYDANCLWSILEAYKKSTICESKLRIRFQYFFLIERQTRSCATPLFNDHLTFTIDSTATFLKKFYRFPAKSTKLFCLTTPRRSIQSRSELVSSFACCEIYVEESRASTKGDIWTAKNHAWIEIPCLMPMAYELDLHSTEYQRLKSHKICHRAFSIARKCFSKTNGLP